MRTLAIIGVFVVVIWLTSQNTAIGVTLGVNNDHEKFQGEIDRVLTSPDWGQWRLDIQNGSSLHSMETACTLVYNAAISATGLTADEAMKRYGTYKNYTYSMEGLKQILSYSFMIGLGCLAWIKNNSDAIGLTIRHESSGVTKTSTAYEHLCRNTIIPYGIEKANEMFLGMRQYSQGGIHFCPENVDYRSYENIDYLHDSTVQDQLWSICDKQRKADITGIAAIIAAVIAAVIVTLVSAGTLAPADAAIISAGLSVDKITFSSITT